MTERTKMLNFTKEIDKRRKEIKELEELRKKALELKRTFNKQTTGTNTKAWWDERNRVVARLIALNVDGATLINWAVVEIKQE
jgi:hypothetical protein